MNRLVFLLLRSLSYKKIFFLFSRTLFCGFLIAASNSLYAKNAPPGQLKMKTISLSACSFESIQQRQLAYKNVNTIVVDKETSKKLLPQMPPEIAFRVMEKSPHDSRAYTQGLVYFEGHLYESTGGLGFSDIRKVDLITGQISKQRALPRHYFAEGLSLVNKQLVLLTLKKNIAIIYDIDNLNAVDQFSFAGDGWGLMELDDELLISNGTSVLQRFDKNSHQLIDQKNVTVNSKDLNGINEMENVEGFIYANIWPTDCIAIIEPMKYQVVA